jgi:uncharacterized protein (TIGR03663 family)
MATVDGDRRGIAVLRTLLDRAGLDAVHVAVANLVLVALVARLWDLGARTAHWDEGRVAYWTIRYIETGNVAYRPIIHGPFYHHVNQHVFGALGPTDFSMRLFVAVAGGLFPLVALLFRDRLRDSVVAALALLLASSPILLYFSRFMRGDPLVAVFMFTAFALFVRAVDRRQTAYVHAGVVFAALGFTVKENAILYLVTWVGAGALVADYRLLGLAGDRDVGAVAKRSLLRGWRLFRRRWGNAVVAVVEFLVVIVYFYAPRRASEPGPGLWTTLEDPTVLPAVVWAATGGVGQDLWNVWVAGDHQDHAYLPFLSDFLGTMAAGALALSLLAMLGFVVDRYSAGGPSALVSFCAYWGVASILGYPLVTDIKAPWATINAVVPLTVPAAVGLGLLGRWAYRAYGDTDYLTASLGALTVGMVVLSMLVTSAGAVYLQPQSGENGLVQYAQPADDIGPVTDAIGVAAQDDRVGADVVLYGEYLVAESVGDGPREPKCAKWFNALPLPWYFAAADADVTCAQNPDDVGATVSESAPAVVIARESQTDRIASTLSAYESRTYRLRAWGTETTVYVHEDYADELPPAES